MELTIPGDKSISQRALILAGLSGGRSRIQRILQGGDPRSTAGVLRKLGVEIPALSEELIIQGRGLRGFRSPHDRLDFGNSGTGARLLMGVLAGQPLDAVLTGDGSLRKRPMRRITDPLGGMGGRFRYLEEEGFLPLEVQGGNLRPCSYHLPMASAQVKSSLLLAGLVGGVSVELVEPGRSRNHTETMLGGLGVTVSSHRIQGGWSVSLADSPPSIPPLDMEVPGDFSSAAFFLVLGLLRDAREPLTLRGVGLNETRTGLLGVLERMGAQVTLEDVRGLESGEPLGDLVVRTSPLQACQVGAEEIPSLIDEIPILAVAATRAEGITRITGAGELRVKETDRIKAVVENLRRVGARAEELPDGMVIEGSSGPLRGRIQTYEDHRIAMAFGVLGALQGNEIAVDHPDVAAVSFPGFWASLHRIARGREHRKEES